MKLYLNQFQCFVNSIITEKYIVNAELSLSIHGGLVLGPPADTKLLCAQVSYIKGIGQSALCT